MIQDIVRMVFLVRSERTPSTNFHRPTKKISALEEQGFSLDFLPSRSPFNGFYVPFDIPF